MRFFIANFKWVMLLSGLLTCTMLIGLISPDKILKSNFGSSLEGPLAELIVRNWSALIGIIGFSLIYGAFVKNVRRFVLVIAAISKIIFISLVLTSGESYFKMGAGTAVIVDSLMVILFTIYLLIDRSPQKIVNPQ